MQCLMHQFRAQAGQLGGELVAAMRICSPGMCAQPAQNISLQRFKQRSFLVNAPEQCRRCTEVIGEVMRLLFG